MKPLILAILLTVGLAISIFFNLSATEENRTTILIHGHESEIMYEVLIIDARVNEFLVEVGEFSCSNMLCHIETH